MAFLALFKPHLQARQFCRSLEGMMVTLDMPKEIEAQFPVAAQARGVTLSDYVRDFIVEHYQEDATIFAQRENALLTLNPASLLISCVKTLAWTVEYDPRVENDLKAIDRAMQREILDYMDTGLPRTKTRAASGSPCVMSFAGCGVIGFATTGLFATFGNKPAWCSFCPSSTVPLLTIKPPPVFQIGSFAQQKAVREGTRSPRDAGQSCCWREKRLSQHPQTMRTLQ
jgi:hypothetical protein